MQYLDEDILTDMPYTIYGEGMYRAIKSVSVLDVPILITENGVADAVDDRRELYIKRYLYAVSKAIEDGFDIRGYFYWSLMDNFEWAFGYDMKFGLFSVDYNTQERSLREGAKAFINIVNNDNDDENDLIPEGYYDHFDFPPLDVENAIALGDIDNLTCAFVWLASRVMWSVQRFASVPLIRSGFPIWSMTNFNCGTVSAT